MTLGLESRTLHPPVKPHSEKMTNGNISENTQQGDNEQPDAKPKRSGSVQLVQEVRGRKVKLPVILKVYSNSFEKYAVISKDCCLSIAKDYGFVNLRSCMITKETDGFQLTPKRAEGPSYQFRTTKDDLEEWLNVLEGCSLPLAPCQSSPRLIRANTSRSDCPRRLMATGGSPPSPISHFLISNSSPAGSPLIPRRSALPSLSETDEET